MCWEDWEAVATIGGSPTEAPSKSGQKARLADWDTDGLAEQLFASDSEVDDSNSALARNSMTESDVDMEMGKMIVAEASDDVSDAQSLDAPLKKKRKTIPSPKTSSNLRLHNLMEIAEKGQGGRIMFILERTTKSKL